MTLYRYIPLKYLRDLLKTKTLYFNNVLNWEDPYENFLFKQTIVTTSGKPFQTNFFCPSYFGQCWTKLCESDAMWRIYSVKTEDLRRDESKLEDVAIKIAVESYTLQEAIKKTMRVDSSWETECKDVIYTEGDDIDCALGFVQLNEYRHISELFMKTLFVKRKAFEHEKEYRFVIQIPQNFDNSKENKYLPIPFETSLIKEFVVDPRISKSHFEQIEGELLLLGIDEGKFLRSILYQPIRKHEIVVNKHGFIVKQV